MMLRTTLFRVAKHLHHTRAVSPRATHQPPRGALPSLGPDNIQAGGGRAEIPNSEFRIQNCYSSIRTETSFDTPGSSMVMP